MPKEYIVVCREPENKSLDEEARLLRALSIFDKKLRERDAGKRKESENKK